MLVFDNEIYQVHQLVVGLFQANCYVVGCNSRYCLIDPGAGAARISDYLKSLGARSVLMLATHCHFDHISAADELIDSGLAAELIIPQNEEEELSRVNTYSLLLCKQPIRIPKKIRLFDQSIREELAKIGLEVLSAPGHTKGSVVLFSHDRRQLFSGDTILHNLCSKDAISSALEDNDLLRQTLAMLCSHFAPSTLLFPGHGKLTTLGVEMKFNSKVNKLLSPENILNSE